jgi:hypothetical protein
LVGNIAQMRETIGYRDDDRFPVDLSYEKWASRVCAGQALPPPYGPMTANAEAACARREREREADRAVSEEASRLQENPQELARQCERTAEQARSPALAQACWPIDFERDRKAGEALVLRQPRRVAADCEATPQIERDGALRSACSLYESALEGALQDRLIEDDAAYAIICQDGRTPPDRAGFADMACSGAERIRTERAVAALLADPVALDASCAATAQNDRGPSLYMACAERSRNLFDEAVEKAIFSRKRCPFSAIAGLCMLRRSSTDTVAGRVRCVLPASVARTGPQTRFFAGLLTPLSCNSPTSRCCGPMRTASTGHPLCAGPAA